MGTNSLRKTKLSLEAEIVDVIPSDRLKAQKIQRQGSSYQVVLPSQWEMHFPEDAEVLKALIRVRVPALGKLASIDYYGMLVMETSDFPLERICKEVR